MFNHIKDAYRTIKDYYHTYAHTSSQKKVNKIYAFFKSILDYFTRKPRTRKQILSDEEQKNLRKGLYSKLSSEYNIEFKPGEIILRSKGLVGKL